ncbi:MAG: hypothetical protein AABX11_01420 [Nanoarchaeota archaeon]
MRSRIPKRVLASTMWPPIWEVVSYDFIHPNGDIETISGLPSIVTDDQGRRFEQQTYRDDPRVYSGTVISVRFSGPKKGAALEQARKSLKELYDTRVLSFQEYLRMRFKPTPKERDDYFSRPMFV